MLLLVELALRFMGIGQSRINQPVAIALKSGLSIPENLIVGNMDSCGWFLIAGQRCIWRTKGSYSLTRNSMASPTFALMANWMDQS